MIDKILQLFRRDEDESRATPEDYEATFSSESGQRVLLDLMVRYRVGKASFSFDKAGRLDIEASARSDAAKVIVADLAQRGKLKVGTADKPSKAKRDKKLTRLPQAATSI